MGVGSSKTNSNITRMNQALIWVKSSLHVGIASKTCRLSSKKDEFKYNQVEQRIDVGIVSATCGHFLDNAGLYFSPF